VRPAEPKRKKDEFGILEARVDRATNTATWMYRNSEEKYKADFKILLEHLKDARDEVEFLKSRVLADWANNKPSVSKAD
jgi:hypothetical protein